MRREQRGAHVDRKQAVPGLDAAGLDSFVAKPARDVDQAVEPTEARDDLFHSAACVVEPGRGRRWASASTALFRSAGAGVLSISATWTPAGLECITNGTAERARSRP
mgnify:CR=1 FL=1